MGEGCSRVGVNRWVYFSYRRNFYKLIMPIILTLSVSPDYYEGKGWLRNPKIIDEPSSSRTILNSIMFALSILIDLILNTRLTLLYAKATSRRAEVLRIMLWSRNHVPFRRWLFVFSDECEAYLEVFGILKLIVTWFCRGACVHYTLCLWLWHQETGETRCASGSEDLHGGTVKFNTESWTILFTRWSSSVRRSRQNPIGSRMRKVGASNDSTHDRDISMSVMSVYTKSVFSFVGGFSNMISSIEYTFSSSESILRTNLCILLILGYSRNLHS